MFHGFDPYSPLYSLIHDYFIKLVSLELVLTCVGVFSITLQIHSITRHEQNSYKGTNDRIQHPFHLIHIDVSRARWFIVLVDDCSRLTWVHLLKSKTKTLDVIRNFFSMVRNQFGVSIKNFRLDNAKDNFNTNCALFFRNLGIIQESSCVNTLEKNSLAERKIGHLVTITRALLIHQHIPTYL